MQAASPLAMASDVESSVDVLSHLVSDAASRMPPTGKSPSLYVSPVSVFRVEKVWQQPMMAPERLVARLYRVAKPNNQARTLEPLVL